MAKISISLEGIDQAISNLNYRSGSIKQKAIMAIREFYTSEDVIKTIHSIDTDALILTIWDVKNHPSIIKSKRRNFSSIKSSINADLEKLSKKDLNPENITILETNVFDMTQEAKNNLLSSFSDAVAAGDIDLDQATNLLKAITEFLDTIELDETNSNSVDLADQIKNLLNKISNVDLIDEQLEDLDEDVEEVELDEDEDLEEVEELDEDFEEVDDDFEEIEIDEDEDLEEVDELDDDIEEIELDEDEDLEEIEELDDDFEEIELDEDEDLEEVEELDEDFEEVDDDFEEIEIDEDEDLEEVDELDDD
ncbi:MAG: hypothetical protein GY699_03305, partial [Desulfobacteraceae bacterium]|nr:hypothetical protein [Desulfobacteraceae bacterium]